MIMVTILIIIHKNLPKVTIDQFHSIHMEVLVDLGEIVCLYHKVTKAFTVHFQTHNTLVPN